MGGVLSKHSRVNQIFTFQGKDFSDSQEDDDDTFMVIMMMMGVMRTY